MSPIQKVAVDTLPTRAHHRFSEQEVKEAKALIDSGNAVSNGSEYQSQASARSAGMALRNACGYDSLYIVSVIPNKAGDRYTFALRPRS